MTLPDRETSPPLTHNRGRGRGRGRRYRGDPHRTRSTPPGVQLPQRHTSPAGSSSRSPRSARTSPTPARRAAGSLQERTRGSYLPCRERESAPESRSPRPARDPRRTISVAPGAAGGSPSLGSSWVEAGDTISALAPGGTMAPREHRRELPWASVQPRGTQARAIVQEFHVLLSARAVCARHTSVIRTRAVRTSHERHRVHTSCALRRRRRPRR